MGKPFTALFFTKYDHFRGNINKFRDSCSFVNGDPSIIKQEFIFETSAIPIHVK